MKRTLIFLLGLSFALSSCTLTDRKGVEVNNHEVTGFIPPQDDDRMRLFDQGWKFSAGETEGAENPGLDDKMWRDIDLPHDWSIEDLPGQKENEVVGPFSAKSIGLFYTGYTVGGTGWYRKTFTVSDSDADKLLSLYFDGVYMTADVWLNGHNLGTHKHGYTPFFFSLNEYLKPAGEKNVVAVHVKNTGENSRWYSGSGIYRHVWLRSTARVNIPEWGVFVTTPEVSEERSKVNVSAGIVNQGSNKTTVKLRNTIISPDGREAGKTETEITLEAGQQGSFSNDLSINLPQLWSVEKPVLYTLETEILDQSGVLDKTETKFGIRSLSFTAGKGFLLNGNKMIMRGACIHHDNGALGSAAFDRAEQRKLELLKKNGFNAIRTSHNPPSQGFLDACDRLGLVVIDEAFDMWQSPKRPDDYHQYFDEYHRSDLRSMVLRDRNHPSVIMWSIGNEIKERADSSGIRIAADLISTIKDLDNTRPVTMGVCEFWETKGRPWKESAAAFSQLDFCGYNYVWGEYEKDHAQYPSRVIAGTESFALDIYDNWKMAMEKPYVTGDFVWTGMDYLGEAGIGQAMTDSVTMNWPWIISNCGDLDITGFRKPQSFYRDVVWDRSSLELAVEEPAPAGKKWLIRAWGWPREQQSWNWPGNEGKPMTVRVYSKSEEVALFLNDSLIGRQRSEKAPRFTYTFIAGYEPGVLKAVAYEKGKELAAKTLVTTGKPEQIVLSVDRPIISTNRNDLAYITAEITDNAGNRIPDATVPVEFSIEGPAVLAGVNNGNPMKPRSFQTSTCETYQGRCIAILRPTGEPGKLTIKAKYGSLPVAVRTVTLKGQLF